MTTLEVSADVTLAALDLETHIVQEGLLAPPIVCGSYSGEAAGSERLLTRAGALDAATLLLADGGTTIVGANIAYDFGCIANEEPRLLRPIFDAYADGRVYDVQIAEAMNAIAGGHLFMDPRGGPMMIDGVPQRRYNLATCVQYRLGRADAKAHDFWRLRYAILADVPMSEWPAEAVQYPKDDARNTVVVAAVQIAQAMTGEFRNLAGVFEQCEAAWALHLGAMWGLRTSRAHVEALAARVEVVHHAYRERFTALGYLRPDGSTNTAAVKRAVALAYAATGTCEACFGTGHKPNVCRGEKVRGRFQGCLNSAAREVARPCVCFGRGIVRAEKGTACENCCGTGLDLATAPGLTRTDGGDVSTSRDTLMESGDDDLAAFGENEAEKIIDTYLPWLRTGLDKPMNLRPNVVVATTRVSYDGLIQLVPRGGGVRECFEAREGRLLGSTDYAAVELCSLAQVCLWVTGASVMADTINASGNPGLLHTAFAAKMVGCSVEELVARIEAKDPVAKGYRYAAKAANFGFPGGMGAAKLVLAKRKAGEGTTTGPNGRVYTGIRFCILLAGAHECGAEKVTEWKGKPIPPTCRACIEVVQHQLRPAYMEAWPEMKPYFEWVSSTVEQSGGEIPCLSPDYTPQLVRGGVAFCDAANNGFQHLVARGAKRALCAVTREAYIDEESPLYQGRVRVPFFAHDELGTEGNADTAHVWAPRVATIMIKEMRHYIPDVTITAETALMRYWCKDAEPVYVDGRVVPWTPKGGWS